MARRRDYRKEYKRRLARGKSKGLTPTQASGHARAGQARLAPASKRWKPNQLAKALKGLRRGDTLKASAKAAGVSEERLRRTLREQKLAHREGGRWVLDEPPKRFPFYSNGVIVKPVLSASETARAASYMNGVGRFLGEGEDKHLRPFAERASSMSTASAIPLKPAPSRSTGSTVPVSWTSPPSIAGLDESFGVDPVRRRLKRAGRVRQAQRRLGDTGAVCVICGESSPHVLHPDDHVAGRRHHDATAILCRNCHDKRSAIQREEPKVRGDPRNPVQIIGRWICGMSSYAELMSDFLRVAGDWLVRLSEHLPQYGETVARIGRRLTRFAGHFLGLKDWLWNAGVFLIRIAETCGDAFRDVPPPAELAAAR